LILIASTVGKVERVDVRPGFRLDRYLIQREIGRGAMGVVFVAEDEMLHRAVAIKLLGDEFGKTGGRVRERFQAEAKTLATLRHRNVLPVIDSGEVDGVPYFVMPLVRGESLAERLRRAGPLPVDEALEVAIAVASALEYAHRLSIVHRDIKPQNVLIPDGNNTAAQLTDFGLHGRLLADSEMTQAGQIFGTPKYMAPEQLLGTPQSTAVDVFGLGVLLYEMLYGTTPWKAESLPALMQGIIHEPVTFPSTPSVSDGIQRFLAACLDKEPSRRPISPLEDLQRLKPSAGPSSGEGRLPTPAAREAAAIQARAEPDPIVNPTAARSASVNPAHDKSTYAVVLIAGVTALAGSLLLTAMRSVSPAAQIAMGGGLTAAGILLGVALRRWLLQQRVALSAEAGRILSGTRTRSALTRSLAIEVDELMLRCRTVDERFIGASLAIMIDEFQQAQGFDDRHRALAASVDFLEKLMNRLSPWYVRYEKLIVATVGLLGVIPGLYQIAVTIAER
jgi:hypothetical protein